MSQSPQEVPGSDDFDRIIASLNQHNVDFMIIGGFAVVYHGNDRMTKDLDIFIRRTYENAKKVVAALEEIGFGSLQMTPEVFTDDNGISLGTRPLQVDIMSNLRGVDFDEAWTRREISNFGPEKVSFISRDDLIKSKRAAGRPLDLDDAQKLELGKSNDPGLGDDRIA